jgi:hypothetical protein
MLSESLMWVFIRPPTSLLLILFAVLPQGVTEERFYFERYQCVSVPVSFDMLARYSSSYLNSEGDAPRRTIGEIAREKRLRDDPMADVIGPLFVTCKRCGNRIKLSPKSLYDPFHWLKHRERCLRKPVGGIRATKRLSREIVSFFLFFDGPLRAGIHAIC